MTDFNSHLRGELAARLIAGVLAVAAMGFVAAPALAQDQSLGAGDVYEVDVSAGKSQVLELPANYKDLMIADPKVADVLPLSSRSVYIVGKTMGSTALTIYGPGKSLIAAVNVVVGADTQGLKTRLAEILPNEKDISVRTAGQSIVLSGTVSSPADLQQVIALAGTYVTDDKKVVNMLGVEGSQQVMLSVRFVEMERSAAKDLQLNVQRPSASVVGANPSFTVSTGDTLHNGTNLLAGTFGGLAARFGSGASSLDLLFDALEQKGITKTLAEPTLVAMSGDTANFLAGGEFPVPVAESSGGVGSTPVISVEFKQFGVDLAFTPTILKDGLINLVINPEVSSIDQATSVNTGGVQVPGLKVRRAHTTVELRDGESFTIAGLLQDDYRSQIRQFPFIGDVPVLGALFRSNGYQKDETELVIVVTPHIVTPRRGAVATPIDNFVPPSDFELFLFGTQEGAKSNLRPEDRALLSADPTKGGIDGAHGHVLY
ncbi:MAG TPA: type II and III secretion system protein family protein [Caulobacteraceae bacterium]|jgi:pilus assembly protein CpaC